MECYKIKRRLLEFLEDELESVVKEEVEKHLKECSNCKKEFERMTRDINSLKSSLSPHALKESVVPEILQKLPDHPEELKGPDEFESLEDIVFTNFVASEKWFTLDEHIKHIDKQIEKDLKELSSENKIIREQVREYLENEFEIKTVTKEQLERAEQELFSTNVAGIDGTCSTYPMIAGIRARIGVVATSYKNERTESVIFVSEQQVKTKDTNVLDIIRSRKTENKLISNLLIRAIMFYMERKKGLERTEKWILFNGPLIPYELRTGIGRLRALEPCLKLCAEMIKRKTVVGVVTKSTHDELISLGLALYPSEYVRLGSIKKGLLDYLEIAHFNPYDHNLMKKFIEQYGNQIDFGLYKAGARTYIFQTHKDFFDEAASLVMRDSLFQPIRGYPLLIDYADSICKKILPTSDFKKLTDFKLAKVGEFGLEIPEIHLRRR